MIHELRCAIRFVDRTGSPSLLPVFRSQQQAELLALLLGDTGLEVSLSELASMLDMAYPSVHREVERAEKAGLLRSHKVGNTRLVSANVESPYFEGLSQVLVRAFGVPAVLAGALSGLSGVDRAFVFGSWAERYGGVEGQRPVNDIDVLVLGDPDRSELYERVGAVQHRLGRVVQVAIRDKGWLEHGSGSFHDTVASRPLVELDLG